MTDAIGLADEFLGSFRAYSGTEQILLSIVMDDGAPRNRFLNSDVPVELVTVVG